MGFRFRKSVKIAPGVRLNFGKKSTSVSLGGKGARFTFNSKGKKTASFGLPGTGLYYTESFGGTKKRKEKSNMVAMNTKKGKAPNGNKPKSPITKKWWFWIIVVGIIFSAFTGGESDPSKDTLQQADTSVSDMASHEDPVESVVTEEPEEVNSAPISKEETKEQNEVIAENTTTKEETEVPEPVTEETPKETEPPVEEPKVETPVVVEPVAPPVPEDPVTEEPIQDEPTPEEPVVEEQPVVQPEPETPPVEVDPEVAFRKKLMQYNYVGSSESDKFHYPKCRWTGEINDQNLVHFDTKEEAADAGYGPCGTCKP